MLKSPKPALSGGYLRLKRVLARGSGEGLRQDMKTTWLFGVALLVTSFFVFLFYGDGAPGIVLLALGVVFIVAGGRKTAPAA